MVCFFAYCIRPKEVKGLSEEDAFDRHTRFVPIFIALPIKPRSFFKLFYEYKTL